MSKFNKWIMSYVLVMYCLRCVLPFWYSVIPLWLFVFMVVCIVAFVVDVLMEMWGKVE